MTDLQAMRCEMDQMKMSLRSLSLMVHNIADLLAVVNDNVETILKQSLRDRTLRGEPRVDTTISNAGNPPYLPNV